VDFFLKSEKKGPLQTMSELVQRAQTVFDLFETPENKHILVNVFRNLLSLERRCRSNENINLIFVQNMSILEKEFEKHLQLNEQFKGGVAFYEFKKILQHLLKQCIKLPASRKLTKLSGPCSFIFFSNVLTSGTKILILGEFHDFNKSCKSQPFYEVQDWLYDLSQDSPECLDIFIESGMHTQQKTTNIAKFHNFTSPLQTVEEQFHDFLTQKQNSNTTRYHFVDVRVYLENGEEYSKLLFMAIDEKDDAQDFYNRWKPYLANIRDYYLGFESRKNRVDFEMMTKQYISEIFQLVHGKHINDVILHQMHNEILRVRSFIKRQLRKSFLFVPKLKEIVKEWEPKTFLSILNIGMDIFLLCRVFSSFDKHKMNRGPLYCQSSKFQVPKNIIIYCGDTHQKFYTFFLKQYFNITPKIQLHCTASKCLTFSPSFDFFKSDDTKDVIEIM
jgi:hypothetical protein